METSKIELEKLQEAVNLFLNKEHAFGKGVPLTKDQITAAISSLKRVPYILEKTSYYMEFLLIYGTIYGSELFMCGPVVENYTGYLDECLVMNHENFDDKFRNIGVEEKNLKYLWTVADFKGHLFYIDVSNGGKGFIFSLDPWGTCRLFAKSFLEFLEKLFELYECNHSEESEDED